MTQFQGRAPFPQGRARLPRGRARLARAAFASACAFALLGGTAGWPRPALAQEAASAVQDVVLSDISLSLGTTVLKIPRATVSGTRLSKDDLMAILRVDSPDPWPVRLARLEAASVTIPVLVAEHPGPGGARQTVTYREVSARDLRAGRIAELVSAGASVSVTGTASKGAGTYGRMVVTDFDLAAAARLYATPGDGRGAVQRIYATVQMNDVVYTDAQDTTVKIARIDGRDLGGRPIPGGWGAALDGLTFGLDGLDPEKELPPAERAKLAGTAADLIEGSAVGGLEITGLSMSVADEDSPFLIEIAKILYSSTGVDAGTTLQGFTLSQGDLRARLGRFSVSGFSLAPTLAALRTLAKPDQVVRDEDLRRLMPEIGGLTLNDLSVELPASEAPPPGKAAKGVDPAPSGPMRLNLRDAVLTLGPTRDGVPTASRLSLSGLSIPPAMAASVPVIHVLSVYGYTNLDLDIVADSAWDEAKREIALREVSVSGREMGAIRLSGTLGGVGPELFSGTADPNLLMLAMTAKSLDLTVENTGLFERFLTAQSKQVSLKPEELRQEYVTASQFGIPVILGNSPAAKTIGTAVSQFVVKPGRLVMTARPKNGTGLGVLDFGTARSPAALLEKLDVTARVE